MQQKTKIIMLIVIILAGVLFGVFLFWKKNKNIQAEKTAKTIMVDGVISKIEKDSVEITKNNGEKETLKTEQGLEVITKSK